MPVIKVWCLPPQSEEQLKALFDSIIAATVSVRGFNFKGMTDTTVLFPSDMMSFGIGTDICIEAGSQAFAPSKVGQEERNAFAQAMVGAVAKHFPKAKIECIAFSYNSGVDCGVAHYEPESNLS
ncbi:MAG: hypothetical protein AAB737_01785 [Patescibacteria group bacterium]